MSTYLAIDPGLTTGVAHYNTKTGEFGSHEIRERAFLYSYLAAEWGFDCIYYSPGKTPDYLIAEDWTVRSNTHRMSQQVDPHRILGALDWWAHSMPWVDFRLQYPGHAKSFSTNGKLRTLGWYTGGDGHADDAARHLLVALVTDGVERVTEQIV